MTNPYPEKLYRNLVVALVDMLHQTFNLQQQTERIVEHALKTHPKWGANDRRFVAQVMYDMVRNWRMIVELSQLEEWAMLSPDELWQCIGVWLKLQHINLPDWDEWQQLPTLDQLLPQHEQLQTIRKYAYSLPDWLDEYGVLQLGESQWQTEIAALHQPTQVHIRTNTLQISKQQLINYLADENVSAKSLTWSKFALQLDQRKNLTTLKSYRKGLFEIQDAGSQLIAPYLDPKANMTVIDACAGAGGKSLHMAALMQNKGHILAMDTVETKLDRLRQRAERSGINIITTKTLVSPQNIIEQHNTADRLLLDVPCSGSGTLRRKPDLKWKMTKEKCQALLQTQQHILQHYSPMLKKGGVMVYATCSIFPSENEQQIQYFLQQNPNFELFKQDHILPSRYPTDGFYMAALRKI